MEENKKTYCIIIPAYNEHLNDYDKIALKSLYEKTNGYNHTYIICPENLNITEYTDIYPNINKCEFPKIFFKSTYTYSQLCLSYGFYNTFVNFDYMLIYQLDCYLFRDEIQQWVDMDYDYIGGPIIMGKNPYDKYWPEHVKWPGIHETGPQVGNGGLSLRKIKTFRYLTDPKAKYRIINTLTQDEISKVYVEDIYFGNIVSNLYHFNMKKPDWMTALLFSMNMEGGGIEAVYKKNNIEFKLPMGCHGWCKNDVLLNYWKQYIPEMENIIIEKTA